MAKVTQLNPDIKVTTRETNETLFVVNLNQEQLYDALLTWLRIKGIQLPSNNLGDYDISVEKREYDKPYEVTIRHTTVR